MPEGDLEVDWSCAPLDLSSSYRPSGLLAMVLAMVIAR